MVTAVDVLLQRLNRLVSNMEDWCRLHLLNQDTIKLLKLHGLNTPHNVKCMTRADIDNLAISVGQKTVIRHAQRLENAQTQIQQVKFPQEDNIDFGWIHYVTETFILCDGCGRDPILGTRFVCTQCDNFDYCIKCFRTQDHKSHVFNRIEWPGANPRYAGISGGA